MENKKFLFLILIFKLLLIIPAAYAAETDWAVHIKVSVPDSRGADGTVWNHLIAGVKDGATDGFDSGWDTLSMTEADDSVQSMFVHGTVPEDNNNDGLIDNWACKGQEDGYGDYNCSLWRDLRTLSTDKVWSMLILSTLNSGTVTLEWSFDNKPKDADVSLVDLSGSSNTANSIDMKNAGVFSYTNTLESGKKYSIRRFEIRMKMHGFYIAPPDLPDATIGSLYGKKLTIVGTATVWSLINGALPGGMTLDTSTGEITGTPTEAGIFKFTLKGEDTSTGYSKSQEYTLNINSIPKIDPSSLPDGILGKSYNGRVAVTGGSSPVKWSVNGNLPERLVLDNKTGIISGMPVVPGSYNFTVMIKDANGATDSADYQIAITEPNDVTPPDTVNDLRVEHITNSSVLLMWSAPADDSIVHTAAIYDMRYIENCSGASDLNDSTWDSAVQVNGEPRPQAGAIQTFTLTGINTSLPYCIAFKSIDAGGNGSALSNVVRLPLPSGMNLSDIAEITSPVILKKGYNLISVPLIPVVNERESLFSLFVGSPVALYRWYAAYPGITDPMYYLENNVQPGSAYFIYSPADNVKFVVDGLKIDDAEYKVNLQNGWNMIGNPYTKTILLSGVMVRNTASGEVKSYLEAVKSGWIGNSLYQLKDGNYDFTSFNDDPPASLEPWVGYWISVNEQAGVEIILGRP